MLYHKQKWDNHAKLLEPLRGSPGYRQSPGEDQAEQPGQPQHRPAPPQDRADRGRGGQQSSEADISTQH